MKRRIFKLYLIFFSLLFILNGCYTLLSDPLKIKPKPQLSIHNIEEQDKVDVFHPMVNRHYGRRTYQPYIYGYDNFYATDSYYYNRYNTDNYNYKLDVSQPPVSQAPTQQSTKVEVKNTPSSRDVEKAKIVWEKRINPRVRKAPTPTKK